MDGMYAENAAARRIGAFFCRNDGIPRFASTGQIIVCAGGNMITQQKEVGQTPPG
jgi:hypothetical protein